MGHTFRRGAYGTLNSATARNMSGRNRAAYCVISAPQSCPTTVTSSSCKAFSKPCMSVAMLAAEVVDAVQVVYGAIPKKIFKTNPDYWMRK